MYKKKVYVYIFRTNSIIWVFIRVFVTVYKFVYNTNNYV